MGFSWTDLKNGEDAVVEPINELGHAVESADSTAAEALATANMANGAAATAQEKAESAQEKAESAFEYADMLNTQTTNIGSLAESAYETARAAKTGLDDKVNKEVGKGLSKVSDVDVLGRVDTNASIGVNTKKEYSRIDITKQDGSKATLDVYTVEQADALLADKADKEDIQTVAITDDDGGTVKKITVTQDGTVQSEEDFYSREQTEERLKRLYGTAEVSGEQVKISDHMSGLSVPSYEVYGSNAQEICPGVCVFKQDEQSLTSNSAWFAQSVFKGTLPPGDYTVTAKYEQLGTQTTVAVGMYKYNTATGAVGDGIGKVTSDEVAGSLIFNVTIPPDVTGVAVSLYTNFSSTVCDCSTKFTEIMVISGTYTEEAIPGYADVSVSKPYPRELLFTGDKVESGDYANKYAVPITVRGRNMLPYPYYSGSKTINGVRITVYTDGRLILNGNANGNITFYLYKDAEMKVSGTYTLSLNLQAGTATGSYYAQPIIGSGSWSSAATADKAQTYEWNGTLTTVAFFVRSGAVFTNAIIAVQLEEGTAATEYEPYYSKTDTVYLDKPLWGFGTTRDCISYAKVTDYEYREYLSELVCCRNVGEIVLSGEENIEANASIKGFSVDRLPYAMDQADGLCNYRNVVENSEMPVDITGGDKMWLGYPGGSTKIHFPYDAFYNTDESDSGLAAFKNWLATLFYEGNPVVVYYPLSVDEQYFEACECPTLTLPDKGTVIVESGCEVKPEIRLSYYRDANKRIAALEAAVIALGGTI